MLCMNLWFPPFCKNMKEKIQIFLLEYLKMLIYARRYIKGSHDYFAVQVAKITWFTHWRDGCWSWNPNTLATWCEELTHWKRSWCWEGLGAGGEGNDRGWDGWMASLTQWTWMWVNSRSWWWIGRPGMLRFMGSQRVGHDWATDLIWCICLYIL